MVRMFGPLKPFYHLHTHTHTHTRSFTELRKFCHMVTVLHARCKASRNQFLKHKFAIDLVHNVKIKRVCVCAQWKMNVDFWKGERWWLQWCLFFRCFHNVSSYISMRSIVSLDCWKSILHVISYANIRLDS